MILPRYPIYVPSKGRFKNCLTAKFLAEEGVPFSLVVEAAERDEYAERFGDEHVLVLPFSDRGSVIPCRNWIKDHATEAGHERHWQLDDNIRFIARRWRAKRIKCDSGPALAVAEDFTDRYTNIAISGLNYWMFVPDRTYQPPFFLNVHVYSCTLIDNSLPNKWRGRYNEDTDMCLQVLADGWCTVLINAFVAEKATTMLMKGGNTDALYQGDGRLKMARELERRWPGVVMTKRRFGRPQHVIADSWRKFDTPLIRREDVDFEALEGTNNEYGLELKQLEPIESKDFRDWIAPDE